MTVALHFFEGFFIGYGAMSFVRDSIELLLLPRKRGRLQVLQVQRLEEKELARLDTALGMSLDEFLIAQVLAEMFSAPAVCTETYETLYREFKAAIQDLKEGNLCLSPHTSARQLSISTTKTTSLMSPPISGRC